MVRTRSTVVLAKTPGTVAAACVGTSGAICRVDWSMDLAVIDVRIIARSDDVVAMMVMVWRACIRSCRYAGEQHRSRNR